MSDRASMTSFTRTQRILQAVAHLEHLLPGQAPLMDFVHHNTLHGFQKYPFPEALARARQVTGIYGYWPKERFRELYCQGRIDRDDLDAVIAQSAELNGAACLGPTRRGEIIRLLLVEDIQSLTSVQLAWVIEEQDALNRVHPAVDTAIRANFVAAGERESVAGLWQACLELFDLRHCQWYREERLDSLDEEGFSDSFHPDRVDESQVGSREEMDQIRHMTGPLWRDLAGRVGVSLTLRGFLLALTGEDILEESQPFLVRGLSAFLDQGVASWSLPDRQLGFYAAWKQYAAHDAAFALEEMPNWCAMIDELPVTAMEAVEECLLTMGLPEERWGGYLERLALETPGWSGMMMWRAQRPDYLGPGIGVRVEMIDYLAVRLVMERLFAMRLCRTLWLVEPSLPTLGWYFRRYRGEFLARWSLFNGELPEVLVTRVTRLLSRPVDDGSVVREWERVAHLIVRQGARLVARQSAGRQAWPVFLLAQHLGLTGAALRQGGRELVEGMFACLTGLDEETVGFLWLQAYERHYRERVFAALLANRGRGRWATRPTRPQAQVVFCMDDREEGMRRHLEERAPDVETLGAAGFFGVPVNWLGVDDRVAVALCPVVVKPTHTVCEQPAIGEETSGAARRLRRGVRLWIKQVLYRDTHRGLMVPTLLVFLAAPLALLTLTGRLLAPGWWGRHVQRLRRWFDHEVITDLTLNAPDDGTLATPEQPRLGLTDAEQVARVAGLLRTMGLTAGFAPLVAILGHGSSSQNNPHLAAYDCGACSGRHGGPNARLFAAMANRFLVRASLRAQGIDIPEDTWFVGGEHDTGQESIDWYDLHLVPDSARNGLHGLTEKLRLACSASAHERARRLASAPQDSTLARALSHMQGRGVDFSQARPELGHATNAVAVIGRRSLTRGVFWDRRLFLISYDPTQDAEGRIVESILLAAGPVGAGISLEYYFSTVNNDRFGCGTKVMHNVTGLFGVMEGSSSDLRTGLPQQMIEIHEPMRLLVVVEQSTAILTAICQRQPEIAELVNHGWIVLAAMDPESGAIQLFQPDRGWAVWENTLPPVPEVKNSATWYAGQTGPLSPALLLQERAYGF